jgi:hypothetical protein
MASTRFDPYLAHAGGAGGWMGRSDPYGSGLAGGELYAQQDPYRQSMLHAPPPAAARPQQQQQQVLLMRRRLHLQATTHRLLVIY